MGKRLIKENEVNKAMVFVYITCKDKEEAKKISRLLFEKRLIACSNYFPIESMYWWNDKIHDDKEFVIIAKTIKENFKIINEEVKKTHSYDVPCICMFDSHDDKNYQEWIHKEVKRG